MPSSSGPDFEGAYERTLAENYRAFDPASSMDRIQSFAKRAGVPAADIARKAMADPIFRWAIVKDPTRQNVYEKEAARWLESLPLVAGFRSHRADKQAARRGAAAAAAVPGLAGPGDAALARNVDFSWRTGDHRVYAAHTHTHDSGGTQGRQYDALHSFIDGANNSPGTGRVFIAIADGQFYGAGRAQKPAPDRRPSRTRQLLDGLCRQVGRRAGHPVESAMTRPRAARGLGMRAFWPAAATVRVTGPARRVAPRRGYSRRAVRQSKPPRSKRVTANVPTHRRAVRVPGRAPRRLPRPSRYLAPRGGPARC